MKILSANQYSFFFLFNIHTIKYSFYENSFGKSIFILSNQRAKWQLCLSWLGSKNAVNVVYDKENVDKIIEYPL